LPRPPPSSVLCPYTTLFRSVRLYSLHCPVRWWIIARCVALLEAFLRMGWLPNVNAQFDACPTGYFGEDLPPATNQWYLSYQCSRSEEHTSELQSRFDLVCRL